jgi:hypothetical protein
LTCSFQIEFSAITLALELHIGTNAHTFDGSAHPTVRATIGEFVFHQKPPKRHDLQKSSISGH